MQKGGEGERGGGGDGLGWDGEGEGGEGRGEDRRRYADTATYPTYSFVEKTYSTQCSRYIQSFFNYSTCIVRVRKS
jgi:hypothetical protein